MSERINTPEERDKHAELMVRFLDLARHIEPLAGKKVEEVLGDEESRRELLGSLSESEFLELANGINGILRDKEKNEWTIDGVKVMLRGLTGEHTPPRQEDKEKLLKKAFEGAKIMNGEGRTLEDIALLLSASINEVHPYADANGRTSRLIHTLLTKGYSEETKAEIKNILGEYGSDIIDINPSLVVKEIENLICAEIGLNDPKKNPNRITNVMYMGRLDKTKFRPDVPEQLKEDFFNAFRHDSTYMNLTMYLYVSEHPEIEKYIKAFPTHASVMLEKILPDLGTDDLTRIMETYWGLKKRYAEFIIDAITHPEKPEYVLRQQEGKDNITLLDCFKARIKQRQQEASSQ